MKKSVALLFLFGLLISLSACSKKTWLCTCTSDTDGSVIEVSKYKLTTEDAESACKNRDEAPGITCILEKN
ncbi:MAG: hypothetical protein AAFP19_13410 [Bacteroidota bacterium]